MLGTAFRAVAPDRYGRVDEIRHMPRPFMYELSRQRSCNGRALYRDRIGALARRGRFDVPRGQNLETAAR